MVGQAIAFCQEAVIGDDRAVRTQVLITVSRFIETGFDLGARRIDILARVNAHAHVYTTPCRDTGCPVSTLDFADVEVQGVLVMLKTWVATIRPIPAFLQCF